jgi:uncharacterized protein (DUF736 family)
MPLAAVLNPSKDGGWEGWLRTLTINAKLRIVPNDDRGSERAPDFKVFAGRAEVGAVWRQVARKPGDPGRLSVKLTDPAFPEGLSMSLFEDGEGGKANLVWYPPRHCESER